MLRNPRTGQVFSWNGSGWQDAGHVGTSTGGDSACVRFHSLDWRKFQPVGSWLCRAQLGRSRGLASWAHDWQNDALRRNG